MERECPKASFPASVGRVHVLDHRTQHHYENEHGQPKPKRPIYQELSKSFPGQGGWGEHAGYEEEHCHAEHGRDEGHAENAHYRLADRGLGEHPVPDAGPRHDRMANDHADDQKRLQIVRIRMTDGRFGTNYFVDCSHTSGASIHIID